METRSLKCKITGVEPLLMHNGQLANPLSKGTQELKRLSGKRNKTDADLWELAHTEWFYSLYLENGKPIIPAEVCEATLIEAAKKSRRGKQAKFGLRVAENGLLVYDGPEDLEALWNDGRFRFQTMVRVQRNRILRTRPIFPEWSTEFTVFYQDDIFDQREVTDILAVAGDQIGFGDWRPRYGRFAIEIL